ncbi:MAG: NUDIX hydrolase [Chitinophagales bacterium]|nr:NUDIX hydrolase [Chitinophagales bacterium]
MEPKRTIMVTVDTVVFAQMPETKGLSILLVKRGNDPFKGMWSLPGGFLEEEEDLEAGARRELKEETDLDVETMVQVAAFGAPDRDPRGRTVSIAFYAMATFAEHPAKAGSDADEVKWFTVEELPSLAFDHRQIIEAALQKVETD